MKGDDPVGLIRQIGADLFDEMLAQGARTCRSLIDPGQIAGVARPIARPPRFRAAAEIATDLDRAVALLARRGAPMIGVVRRAVAGQRLGRSLRGAAPSSASRSPGSSSGFCSISASTNALNSRLDSCSILIACCSCGVMTKAWLWRSSSR
jgi:hypothetical protein